MSLVIVLFHKVKKVLGIFKGYLSLIFFWISMEFLHLNWELAWPWLTLGNVFATFPDIVQWYEYTGVLGGTLWILILNLLLYAFFTYKDKTYITYTVLILIVPIIFSFTIKPNLDYLDKDIEVVIVQLQMWIHILISLVGIPTSN